MANKLHTIPECDLGFVEVNPNQSPTILFLHGALSIPLEASLVTPNLLDYHILIPAIHTNINPSRPRPSFSIANICSQVAVLIQNRAKNGQAHIYGHSMGAHLALNLAMLHPSEVLTVIASGLGMSSRMSWWKQSAIPSVLYAQAVLPRTVLSMPRQIQLFNSTMRPASDTIAAEFLAQPLEGDWAYCKEMAAEMANSMPQGRPIDVKARALIIAGTATMGDSIDSVKLVVKEIKRAGGEARGIEIKQGGHPWILQLPELCADVIKAWIDGREMPKGATDVK